MDVEWVNRLGIMVGISGPYLLAPQEIREFTMAFFNPPPGIGVIEPYILDVPRNGGSDFEGSGRVRCFDDNIEKLGVNATLVIDIEPINRLGANYTSIK